MSRFLIFFIALVTLSECKKQPIVETKDKGPIYSMQQAFDFQYEAMEYFNKDARRAANAFLKAAEAYKQNGMKKDVGICLSNAAHLYEEQFANVDSALLLAQQGLDYSIEANDTLNKGHGYRYTGFLIGISSNNLTEAKNRIEKSKEFYALRYFDDAIAVADYDLARVYYKQKLYDLSEQKLKESTEHFKEKKVLQRIFNNNLFGLRLYQDSGNTKMYNQVKAENEFLSTNEKINDQLRQKFQEIINRK